MKPVTVKILIAAAFGAFILVGSVFLLPRLTANWQQSSSNSSRVTQEAASAPVVDQKPERAKLQSFPVPEIEGGYTNPFQYCSAAINKDGGEGGIDDSQYTGMQPPKEVVRAVGRALNLENYNGAVEWRCMHSAVYGCNLGASGRGCRVADTSERQLMAIRQFCQETPNSDYIANAVNYSDADWGCRAGMPYIINTYPLDEGGYIKGAWIRVEPESEPIEQTESAQENSDQLQPGVTEAEAATQVMGPSTSDVDARPSVQAGNKAQRQEEDATHPDVIAKVPADYRNSVAEAHQEYQGASPTNQVTVAPAIVTLTCVESGKRDVVMTVIVNYDKHTVKSQNFGSGRELDAEISDSKISWHDGEVRNYGMGGNNNQDLSIDRAAGVLTDKYKRLLGTGVTLFNCH